jgi:hypothetical protein
MSDILHADSAFSNAGSSWDLFKEHHYLTETMNGSSRWTMFAWEQVFFKKK